MRKFFYEIYTIQDGIAVRQEQFELDPECDHSVLLCNGTIRVRIPDMGVVAFSYYRFENGEIKHKTGIAKDERSHDVIRYFHANVDEQKLIPITKEEFERVQKEFEGDGQVVELDWRPLADYGKEGSQAG